MADVSPQQAPADFDPEAYRMTLGDHLEELRRRLIYALIGFFAVGIFCLIFGQQLVSYFCKPLWDALIEYDVNPQIVSREVGDPFSVYIQVSMICACVFASPWIVWQFWQFVAAGLYPNERKTVTRYVPLSIGLLIGGDIFVYKVILPWTLQFFLAFGQSIPVPESPTYLPPTTQPANVTTITSLAGIPDHPPELGIWYDTTQKRIRVVIEGKVRTLQFGAENLITPQYTLPEYIDTVLSMLVVFGLSFQLPLVILALVKVGILEVENLRRVRRVVYFVLAVVSAVITPGDAITSTVGLMLPLCLLFELGLFLAARSAKADAAALE